jgi:AcrR family transcriptional regulator
VLEATVEALVELGVAGTTTTEIARRAGVSQGALFKHYTSKRELLAAALEHLLAALVQEWRRDFARAARREDPIGAALPLLWRIFTQPRLHAVLDLYVATRTDAELRAVVGPVLERHRENLRREARALFPAAAERGDDFEGTVDALIAAMQGAAIGALALPDAAAEARQLAFLERIARSELG